MTDATNLFNCINLITIPPRGVGATTRVTNLQIEHTYPNRNRDVRAAAPAAKPHPTTPSELSHGGSKEV